MKRLCAMLLALVMTGLLAGCNFTASDGLGKKNMEHRPQVEQMLTALAAGDTQQVTALMHPEVAEQFDGPADQMARYLAGRKTVTLEQISLNVTSSAGTAGSSRLEQAVFRAELEDGEAIYVTVTHLADGKGSGFTVFQIVLGAL